MIGTRRGGSRCTWGVVVTVVSVLLNAGSAMSQYVERRSYEPSAARYVAGGVFAREFTPRSSNAAPDSLVIRYKRLMPFLMYRQGSLEITFGYTTYDLPGRSARAAVFLGSSYVNEFPLGGSREGGIVVPLLIAADFSKSEGAGSDRDDFNVASIGIGTGLKYRFIGAAVDGSVSTTVAIHYSFQGYSTRSGSSPAVLGEAVLLFKNFPVWEGVAIGYRFRYQGWSTGGFFDYNTVNHGIFIGVIF